MEVQSLKRKVLEIEVSNVIGGHDILVRVFTNLGFAVRTLTVSDSKIDDFTFKEILRSCDSLENLILTEIAIVKKLPAITPVSMRKLQSLTINHCDWNIVKFMKAQLKCLSLKSYLDEGQRVNMISFLSTQFLLRTLILRGTSSKTLFHQDDLVLDCNFQLKKFHLEHYFGKNSDNVNWHITAFMSLHTETLLNVEISGPHCEHLNSFAIANLDHLESLAIDVRGLPKDEDFYETVMCEPNQNLKELALCGFFGQHESIKKILIKYPAIEQLDLNDWSNGNHLPDMLEFISLNFPRLLKLSITEIPSNNNVKFSTLRDLRVTFIKNSGKLVQFLALNSSVESLKVGLVYIEQITSEFMHQLKELQHVKHIAFSGNGKALDKVLDFMKRKSTIGGLKSLELALVTDEKSPTNPTKGKKFYFPISEAMTF